MKAFRIIVPGYERGIIKAETAGKARYQAYLALRDAIGTCADFKSIAVRRAPEYDDDDFFGKRPIIESHYPGNVFERVI